MVSLLLIQFENQDSLPDGTLSFPYAGAPTLVARTRWCEASMDYNSKLTLIWDGSPRTFLHQIVL